MLAERALATTLPDRSREIVRLRVVERRPAAVVAAQMGISEHDVRSQVSRSLRVAAQAPAPALAAGDLDTLPALRAWLRATPEPAGARRAHLNRALRVR